MDQQVDLEELDLDDTDEEMERPPPPSPIVCHRNPRVSSVSNLVALCVGVSNAPPF